MRDSGGTVVGHTRLQKIAYLLCITGLVEKETGFVYGSCGPYSDEVERAARSGALLGLLEEEEVKADWGGYYFTYSVDDDCSIQHAEDERVQIAKIAADAGTIALDLATTAVFLAHEGSDPWSELVRLKPLASSEEHISEARELLNSFRHLQVPRELPESLWAEQ